MQIASNPTDSMEMPTMPASFRLYAFKSLTLALASILFASALASEGADRARADLAKRLNLKPEEVTVVNEEACTWSDGALGLRKEGQFVTEALVPGSIVELAAKGMSYMYTTGGPVVKFGGPTQLQGSSLLHLSPRSNDPNLNSDLVQTSMLGYNPQTLIQGVSSFVPFHNGAVMATRRTSRSGFDLLYLAPGATQAEVIAGAFDFGAYALDDGGKAWAAVRRRIMGLTWEVAYSDRPGGDAKIADLPDGKTPSRLAWLTGKLYAQTAEGWYKLDQTWTKAGAPFIEADHGMMLSRSITLVVEPGPENDKPTFHVVKLWFNGKRDIVAAIPGQNVACVDLVARRWLLVTCRSGKSETALVVDIATGLVMPALTGEFSGVRAFNRPSEPPKPYKQ